MYYDSVVSQDWPYVHFVLQYAMHPYSETDFPVQFLEDLGAVE